MLLLCLLWPYYFVYAADLQTLFQGRSGTALVFDLKKQVLVGSWNENRARQTPIRPGSVLKPFTLAAFIEAGLYRPSMNAPQALAESSNEFFDRLVTALPADEIERGYARFGLNYRAPTMTVAQLMDASKRLLARHRDARLRPVFEGMEQAVRYGTARLAAIPAVKVAGKTGTTNTSALFFGYAPAEDPRYLVWIQLDTGSGGGDAAPFASKVFAGLFTQMDESFDPSLVRIRLFWQNPPNKLNLKPGSYPAGTWIDTGVTRMKSPGPLKVAESEGRYLLTASIPIEDYVAAVLHGEAGGFRHKESREAMAITARTFAARFRHRHGEEGFDYCDTTHCQDARFLIEERADLRAAVEATTSELIWYEGKPVAAYYHADSGGWLEGAGDGPYLKQRPDPWWKDVPEAHWTWSTTVPNLAAALNLTIIRPVFRVRDRETSGRARSLDVFGHPAEAAAFRMLVGRTLGWEKMPSRLFEVSVENQRLTFRGVGRGHGIGLAQASAERMAVAGKTKDEILSTYFPGTKVGVSAGGLRWTVLQSQGVTLWTTNVARDRSLLALADRELRQLSELVKLKVQPVIRVYPSREAFRDATGITANVHGATRGRHVKLPPGVQLATLRHELMHALLEANGGAGAPAWRREGLVQALLGERSEDATRVESEGVAKTLANWIQSKE